MDYLKLHSDMIYKVGGTVDRSMPQYWTPFMHTSIMFHLTQVEQNGCKTFANACDILMEKKLIQHGDYKNLISILDQIRLIQLRDYVKQMQKQIKQAKEEYDNGTIIAFHPLLFICKVGYCSISF